MAYKKMTESEMTGLGVSSAGNILTGTAEQNKKIFDKLPIAIGKNLNEVIDELEKKADGETIWGAVNAKSDKTEVEALEEEVAKKADKTEVDEALEKKADATDIYDKAEIDEKLKTENLLPDMSEITEDSALVGYLEPVEGRQVSMSIDLIQPVKGGTYSGHQGGSAGTDYVAFSVDGDITEIPAGSVIIIDSQEYTLIVNLTLSDANILNIREHLYPAVSGDTEEGDITFIISDKPIEETEVAWNDDTEPPDVLPAGTVFDFYLETTYELLEDVPMSETEGVYVINRTTQLSPSIDAYTEMGPDGISVILPATVKPACRWEKLSGIGGGDSGGGGSADLADYYTKDEVDEKLEEVSVNVDLSDYYTASQVDTAIQTAIGDVLGGAS